MHRAAAAIVLLLIVGTPIGCGGERRGLRVPADHGGAWHAEDGRRAMGEREFIPIQLPEARHATPDDASTQGDVPRMVWNLMQNGLVVLKGSEYDLRGDRPLVLEALRQEVSVLVSDPNWRQDGRSRIPILLHADADLRWGDVADLFDVCLVPEVGIERVAFAVRSHWNPMRQRIDALLGGPRPAPEGTPTVVLRATPAVQVFVGEARAVFPPGDTVWPEDLAERRAWIDEANRVWSQIEAALDERGGEHVTLQVEPDVPLAYVIGVVDLLLPRSGVVVHFPRTAQGVDGFTLRFDDVGWIEPFSLTPGPAVRVSEITWMLLAILAALAVAATGFRRR